jgi:hypothetical protein
LHVLRLRYPSLHAILSPLRSSSRSARSMSTSQVPPSTNLRAASSAAPCSVVSSKCAPALSPSPPAHFHSLLLLFLPLLSPCRLGWRLSSAPASSRPAASPTRQRTM